MIIQGISNVPEMFTFGHKVKTAKMKFGNNRKSIATTFFNQTNFI